MDDAVGELERGDVLIDGAQIAAVGPSLEATADEVVDVSGKIVIPGLVDTHLHLWQTALRGVAAGAWSREYFSIVHPFAARLRPEDTQVATYGGALELLSNGVTTVMDFCHAVNSPAHADASVDALERSGIRAQLAIGFRDRPEVAERAYADLSARIADVRRLADERHGRGDGRVEIAVAMNNPDHVDGPTAAQEYGCARELGIRATLHSDLGGQVVEAHERGLLGPDILWVHCIAITDPELALLRDHGGTIIATPEIEAGLMAATPVVGRALRAGVPLTLGVDIVSAVSGSLLTQMRVTYAIDRLQDSQLEHAQGREPKRSSSSPTVDAARILRLGTIDGARALGLDDRIGSLTPGKLADVLVLDEGPLGRGAGDAASHVLFQTSDANVDTVLVGGVARVRRGVLVDVDLQRTRAQLEQSRDYLTGRAEGVSWREMTPRERAAYEATLGQPTAH